MAWRLAAAVWGTRGSSNRLVHSCRGRPEHARRHARHANPSLVGGGGRPGLLRGGLLLDLVRVRTMSGTTVTLTTDFGETSPYVAAMKGVLLSINPEVRILDLSHEIPPQDVRHAAFFL